MTKRPPPPETPKSGAGLGQLFPEDEAVTGKMRALPGAEGDILCPICGGGGDIHVALHVTNICPLCEGVGLVPRQVREDWIAANPHSLAAKQLKK